MSAPFAARGSYMSASFVAKGAYMSAHVLMNLLNMLWKR